jgi:hypothetical protein
MQATLYYDPKLKVFLNKQSKVIMYIKLTVFSDYNEKVG